MDGYYLNGPGVEGLVLTVRLASGRYPDNSGIFCNSEGDTCIVQFSTLDEAVHVAKLAADMIKDRQSCWRRSKSPAIKATKTDASTQPLPHPAPPTIKLPHCCSRFRQTDSVTFREWFQ